MYIFHNVICDKNYILITVTICISFFYHVTLISNCFSSLQYCTASNKNLILVLLCTFLLCNIDKSRINCQFNYDYLIIKMLFDDGAYTNTKIIKIYFYSNLSMLHFEFWAHYFPISTRINVYI